MTGIYFAGNFLSKSTGLVGVNETLAEKFSHSNWQIVTASKYKNRILRMADFLLTAFLNRKYYNFAVLEVYSFLAFRWVELLCVLLRRLDKPYILSLHGGRLPEFAQAEPVRFKNLLQSASKVTTPSILLKNTFSTIRDDIAYIPNGIDIDQYPFRLITDPEPHLIWMRAFHAIYNPKMAINVLNLLQKKSPNSKLLMIGPDSGDGSFESVRKLIDDYRLSEKVNLTGAVPKSMIGQVLSQGNIFLNTTNYESFGISLLEAAACGLCNVTTNVGELPYLWKNESEALLVPQNDPISMSIAVQRILSEPGLAKKLSINARKKAETFDWSHILPLWEQLFSEYLV